MAAVYLPVRALTRSQAVRIAKQKLSTSTTTYVNIEDGTTKKDLVHHSAIGALQVVGPLTASNEDWVVNTGATTTVSLLKITVAAGEIKQRSTGTYVAVAGGETTLSAASETQDRTDLIWVDHTGTVGHTSGTPAAKGTSVAPATPEGKIPVATYLVAEKATAATNGKDVRPRP